MEGKKDVISIDQMVSILILTAISTGILSLPRRLAEIVPFDHWIILLASGLGVAVMVAVYAWIIKLKPGEQYFDILTDALSRPGAYIAALLYIVYYIGLIGFVTRIFGEVIKVYLLVKTPIEVINVSILVSCIYLSRKGVEVLGRLSMFVLPIGAVVTVILFLLSLTKTNFRNMLPVFQISPIQVLQGVPATMLSFLGLEVSLFFGSNLEKPKESTRMLIAVAVVVLFYLTVLITAFAQFGPIQMKSLVWPTLDLFDTVDIPGLFIENVQVLVMSTWVMSVFTTIAPLYLSGTIILKSITGFRDQAALAAFFLPFIYFISLIPQNLAHVYKAADGFTRYFASIVVVGVPLIVLISLLVQKRLNKGASKHA
ncbi:MAG TPA: endospore germination permease [Clostridia bacterium]|nr:endospore germination permease [Clostridia bacterium]